MDFRDYLQSKGSLNYVKAESVRKYRPKSAYKNKRKIITIKKKYNSTQKSLESNMKREIKPP